MSYGRGHVRTTATQRASASDWYRKIEAATLARLEATWDQEGQATLQEVTEEISGSDTANSMITPNTTYTA